MPQSPFRKGIDPLIKAGLFDKPTDPLGKFLWDAEKLYLDNLLLQTALAKAGINVEAVLKTERPRGTSPGSPGHHRKVFDQKYRDIAHDQLKRYTFLAKKASPKNPLN